MWHSFYLNGDCLPIGELSTISIIAIKPHILKHRKFNIYHNFKTNLNEYYVNLHIINGNWSYYKFTFSSVQFSHSFVSNSLRTHEPQHARPPCPTPTLGGHPNSCPMSQWYHPTILSFVVPFSSRPQSFPASGSFQMSQLFASGGQSIGASASASVLPMNTQDWSPLGWTGWIFLQYKDSQESSPTP